MQQNNIFESAHERPPGGSSFCKWWKYTKITDILAFLQYLPGVLTSVGQKINA